METTHKLNSKKYGVITVTISTGSFNMLTFDKKLTQDEVAIIGERLIPGFSSAFLTASNDPLVWTSL